MKFNLNRQTDQTLIEQIASRMIESIQLGLLIPGGQLPSMRNFAKDHKVSLVTVSKAYHLLEKKGYIRLVHGKGAFVKESKRQQLPTASASYDWQKAIPDYIQRSEYLFAANTHTTYELSSAIIHPGLLPSNYLTEEIHQLLQQDQQIVARYGPLEGDAIVREVIQCYLLRHGQLQTNSTDLIVTSGVQQGIDLVARTFIGPGDVVVTEGPTYTAALDCFRNRGAHIIEIPMDEEGMQVDALATLCLTKKPKLVYTIPTFQNPTGTVLSKQRRRDLLELAQRYGFLILEDDSWNEIYFEEKVPPSPIKSFDSNGHVIYLKGFSKALAPSCRIGVAVANGTVHQRLLASKACADLGSPLLTQKALVPFLQSARMEQHLQKLRIALEIRRDKVHMLLQQYAPENVTWNLPAGGLNIWLTLPPNVNTSKLFHEAQQMDVSFLPSAACYLNASNYNQIRISFSYLDDQILEQGIKKLCHCIELYFAILGETINKTG